MAVTDADLRLMSGALDPIHPGPLLRIAGGDLAIDIAPQAGGRLASVRWRGTEWLHGHRPDAAAMIGWGCYPMLPWAGRLRHGHFQFAGQTRQLRCNFGAHAIHGVGFALPWDAQQISASRVELTLDLPRDPHWPFGGRAWQSIEVDDDALQLQLAVTAGEHSMPCVLGWHPWFLKPEQLHFTPDACYPRDREGVTIGPPQAAPPPPWDDCFLNHRAVRMQRSGQHLELTSDCRHWVVYDERQDVTCVEPQTGPPDAFNIEPHDHVLESGATRSAWMRWRWMHA